MVGLVELTARRKIATGLVVASLIVLAGLFLVTRSGSATQSTRPSGRLNFPPFEMVRVVTPPGGPEAVFHLRWESEERWRETLILNSRPVPPIAERDRDVFLNLGSYQEAIDGKLIRFDKVRACMTCEVGRYLESQRPDGATLIPGHWFVDRHQLVRSREQTEVSETATDVTVRVYSPRDIEEYTFDKLTGIPIGFRVIGLDGTVGSVSRATSVVLLSGQVVR